MNMGVYGAHLIIHQSRLQPAQALKCLGDQVSIPNFVRHIIHTRGLLKTGFLSEELQSRRLLLLPFKIKHRPGSERMTGKHVQCAGTHCKFYNTTLLMILSLQSQQNELSSILVSI